MTSSASAEALLAQVMQRNETIQVPSDSHLTVELGIESLGQSMRSATESVFAKMCGIDLHHSSTCLGKPECRYELSGIVTISGSLKATIVINIDADLAFAVSEVFLGDRPTEVDASVIDMVGELANMIGGNAKERLIASDLSLGLPTVITGLGHCIAFSPDMQCRVIQFKSALGKLQLEVGCS